MHATPGMVEVTLDNDSWITLRIGSFGDGAEVRIVGTMAEVEELAHRVTVAMRRALYRRVSGGNGVGTA